MGPGAAPADGAVDLGISGGRGAIHDLPEQRHKGEPAAAALALVGAPAFAAAEDRRGVVFRDNSLGPGPGDREWKDLAEAFKTWVLAQS